MPLACTGPATQTWRTLFVLLMISVTARTGNSNSHHQPPRDNTTSLSPLHRLNPWVSACDLSSTNVALDLKGTCDNTMRQAINHNTIINSKNNNHHSNNETVNPKQRGPGPPLARPTYSCPADCSDKSSCSFANLTSHHTTDRNTKCLCYLDKSHKTEVCGRGGGVVDVKLKESALGRLRLRHCCEHAVLGALGPEGWEKVAKGGLECHVYLQALIELDALAARVTCELNEILMRYDCGQAYSVMYGCGDCKEAYRQWVCSSLVPHFNHQRHRVRPCRDVCQKVEQRCPYFLPGDRAPAYPTQYAGEPTFLCLDPNIPETGDQLTNSSYGHAECCYTHCAAEGLCSSSAECGHHNASAPPSPEHTPCSMHASQLPASSVAPPTDVSGRTVVSACANTNYGQMTVQQTQTSGTSRVLLGNNCWMIKLVQFYVVTNIMDLLLHILFSLVKVLKRIYVFGYT